MTSLLRLLLAAALLVFLAGCGKKDHDHSPAPAGGHAHTAPHGGLLVEIGEHAYNLEVVRDTAAGKLTVWVLDSHAENFVRLKAGSIDGVATLGAEKRPFSLLAVANPATGETVGDTSQFEVQTDWLKATASLAGIVPTLEIRGTRFEKISFTLTGTAK